MRISASTNPASFMRLQQRGFTLLEIMVVLVIVGIVIGLAGLALDRNPAQRLDREGRRLQAMLSEASDEAVMQGEELALALSRDPDNGATHYQLLLLDKKALAWKRPEFKGKVPALWAVHSLGPDISLALELEGKTLSQAELDQLARVRSLQTPDGLRPSILLFSSGEVTPFNARLTLAASDYSVSVQSDGFSGVFLQ